MLEDENDQSSILYKRIIDGGQSDGSVLIVRVDIIECCGADLDGGTIEYMVFVSHGGWRKC